MGLLSENELPAVSKRLKGLRKELARKEGRRVPQYEVAHDLNVPPRTYQSWENGEVETDGENYTRIARYYKRKLRRPVSRNYILYGTEKAPALPSAPRMQEREISGPASREDVESLEHRIDQLVQQVGAISGLLAKVSESQERLLRLLPPDEQPGEETGN